ncbi:MAG: hypothetical protein WCH34_12055 [Bacteroidota bacterium]
MSKKGWQGAANVMILSMEKSIQAAVSIVVYHLSRLFMHKGEGEIQLNMYNDFLTPANDFVNKVASYTGDKEAQVMLTESFESEFMEMSPNLDDFDSLTREVHSVNSLPYNLSSG